MNIYEYLTSPDIAAHCEKIGHVFNPLEMAVIVELSNKPMKEKHVAWREIIADYPDMPIQESVNFKARDSLHNYLLELIAIEEKAIEGFYTQSNDVIYRSSFFRFYGDNKNFPVGFPECYLTAQNAISAAQQDLESIIDSVREIYICKDQIKNEAYSIRDPDHPIGALFDYFGNLLGLEYIPLGLDKSFPKTSIDLLSDIFVHIPVPFEKGDLVTMDIDKPRVLVWTPQWGGTRHPSEDCLSGHQSYGSYIFAQCYYFDNDHLILDYIKYKPLNLQYFKGELEGQERFLEYLSKYMKAKDDNIDWLINVFSKFKAETEYEKIKGYFDGWYQSLEKENLDKM
ncbi:MAG: hypothetical protein FWH57_09415 [Oscillospiraceae bacterium]|nr:hypothetical protein [Oscillospiraceae bacterium]